MDRRAGGVLLQHKHGNVMFLYTNTTYHEVKVYDLNTGQHSYKITCSDLWGNEGYEIINFTITTDAPDNIILPSTIYAYQGIVTSFTAEIYHSPNPVIGIGSENFNLYINSDEIPFQS